MKAGAEVADQSEVSFDDLRRMLRAGVDSIQARGKAQLGDKTMLDSYLPGLTSSRQRTPATRPPR